MPKQHYAMFKNNVTRKQLHIQFYLSVILFGAGSLFIYTGCMKPGTDAKFEYFSYTGNDPIYEQYPLEMDEYYNPIISGFYPDPSIVRVEDDYYLVHSSFSYFPGIPVFHSKDLVNWTQIGNVLDRPTQMPVDSLGISRGVFAPTIEYNDGTFYVLNTLVDAGGNFMVTAKDPAGLWSEPIWLDRVGGIDPSIFFDDDGKVYILNNDAPEGGPLYEGHRAVWIREYDVAANKSISAPKVIINGGIDLSARPIWIEGPHLMKINGEYFLLAAEGGTGPNHSQVVLKGNNAMGPFTPGPIGLINPILTQRHIPVDREFPVEYTGHADIVETANNEWWSVFLGVRPYDGRNFNTGRETFLLPVSWKDGWPVILQGDATVPVKLPRPNLPEQRSPEIRTNGNFEYTYNFNNELGPQWLFIRTPRENWHSISGGYLNITPRSAHISSLGQPSFVGHRQKHAYATVETKLNYKPKHAGDEAGLVAFQNREYYLFFGLRMNELGSTELQLRKVNGNKVDLSRTITFKKNKVSLKLEARGGEYDFYFSTNNGSDWELFYKGVDGRVLSTENAGGFVGAVVGMYAFSNMP